MPSTAKNYVPEVNHSHRHDFQRRTPDFVQNGPMHADWPPSPYPKNQVRFDLERLLQCKIQGQTTGNAQAPKKLAECDESGLKRFLVKRSSLQTLFQCCAT